MDAVVAGRIGVDLTPSEARTSLSDATSFVRAVGGFAGNIGVGLARLGVRTAVLSAVGDDAHGEHVRTALRGESIDVSGIATKSGSLTQVAFFEVWPPEDFPVTFYRPAPAPDTRLDPVDVAAGSWEDAQLVVVSGTLLAVEPARAAIVEALERRAAARAGRGPASWTILDLDWRPSLWPNPADYPGQIARAAACAGVLIGGDAEFAAAGLAPIDALAMLDDTGAGMSTVAGSASPLVVLKHGPDGVALLDRSGERALAGIAVEVVSGLGAGDALTAAFGAGLLGGLDPYAALVRGNAAGAIVASRLMCSSAMPTPAEIDALLAGQPIIAEVSS